MSSLTPFRNQGSKTIPNGPPMRPNSRASEADVRKMTGHSGPISGSHTKHVRHTVEGDHRQAGLHSGSQNSSVPPRVQGGKPQQFPPRRNGGYDGDAA